MWFVFFMDFIVFFITLKETWILGTWKYLNGTPSSGSGNILSPGIHPFGFWLTCFLKTGEADMLMLGCNTSPENFTAMTDKLLEYMLKSHFHLYLQASFTLSLLLNLAQLSNPGLSSFGFSLYPWSHGFTYRDRSKVLESGGPSHIHAKYPLFLILLLLLVKLT